PAENGETALGEGDTAAGELCGEPLLFYATRETWEALEDQPALMGCRFEGKRECCFCEPFRVGDIVVEPFHLSHDAAAATGYSFTADGRKLTIITDTGVITDEIRDHARGSDLLVLEANHDVEMLRIGGYPWFLKQRILGPYGHLSNDTAAELVCDLLREGMAPGTVALAHLSQQNNFPEMAWQTLANALEEQGFVLGRDIAVKILVRDTISEVFTV
ncbi:MAG: MBL fold metallo-hydrolase, partial [Firmicutes bacterium]|nr:MBL fold metallo-hydrolase [Bacillota bacterium]